MPVSKVSVSLDDQVLAEARGRVGGRGLSSYVNEAVQTRLQHDRIGELLAEMASEAGPIPDHILEEARQIWQGASPRPRRRTG